MKPKPAPDTVPNTAIDIAQVALGGVAQSPEHKRFRSLLARIEQARQRLQAWREELPRFAQLHAEHVQPIERRVDAARRAWAFELEQLLLRERFSRAEQATLARMITSICASFLTAEGADSDPELKALHDRHADQGFDELQALALQALRERIEAATDLDLGDGPVESFDELMARAREQQRAQADEAAQRPSPEAPQWRRKQTAAERREQAEAAQATQSVREVYRKLAAVLHPDRIAADVPDAERAARTAQMAQANAAYAAGDLLALLTLQLQVEQIDEARAGQLAATQVRQFNRVLNEQLREIEMDIAEREHAFSSTYGVELRQRPDPMKLAPHLKDAAAQLINLELDLRDQRRALLGEPRSAKRWLKQMQAEFRLMDHYDELGF
jgi:curved DNA-binding protein CbpA